MTLPPQRLGPASSCREEGSPYLLEAVVLLAVGTVPAVAVPVRHDRVLVAEPAVDDGVRRLHPVDEDRVASARRVLPPVLWGLEKEHGKQAGGPRARDAAGRRKWSVRGSAACSGLTRRTSNEAEVGSSFSSGLQAKPARLCSPSPIHRPRPPPWGTAEDGNPHGNPGPPAPGGSGRGATGAGL